MAKIKVAGKEIEVKNGTGLLEALEENHVDITAACGGMGACGTCHCIVKHGGENLSLMTEEEEDTLDQAAGVTLSSRLACKVTVEKGEVEVEIP
jgi:2Fe-2S ferredoxin